MNWDSLEDVVSCVKKYDLDIIILSKAIERKWYITEQLPKSKDLIEYFKDINHKIDVHILDIERPIMTGNSNLGVKMYNISEMLAFGQKCLDEGECNLKMINK